MADFLFTWRQTRWFHRQHLCLGRLASCLFSLAFLHGLVLSAVSAAPPVVVLRAGHAASVSQICFSPDGRTVATLGGDQAVNLWDARTGVRTAHWQPAAANPSQIAFSPDGTLLAVGGFLGTGGELTSVITLLNAHTGVERSTLTIAPRGQSDMLAFAWSPDGSLLAVTRRNAPAALWDVAAGTVRLMLPAETTGATGIAFAPAGDVVTTRFNALSARLGGMATPAAKPPIAWDAHTGTSAALPAAPALPADLAGLTTLAAGSQGRLVLGDLERQDVSLQGRIIPGRRIVSTTPVFWDPATGKSARGEKIAGALTNVQWSQDGTRVAAAHGTSLLLFDAVSGAALASMPMGQITGAIALAPKGDQVAAGEEDGTVAVFATATQAALWRAPGRTTGVQALALSPDGGQLISAHADGTLALWDLRAGRLIKAVRLPDFKIVTAAWSPDGATLATSEARQRVTATLLASGVPPSDVRLWNVPAFTVRQVIPATDTFHPWSALAFSPDSSLLAGVHDGGGISVRGTGVDSAPAVLWDPKSGTVRQAVDGSFAGPQAVVFAPKGGLLALTDRNTFNVYDAPAYTQRPSVAPNAGGFTAIAFSPDGQTLITGNQNGRIRFWPMTGSDQERRQGRYGLDPKTKQPAGDDLITTLSVSPQGDTVASGGADRTIRMWTIATGALAAELPAQDDRITALRYLPGGLLVSGEADGTIRVWDPKTTFLRETLTLLPADPPAVPAPVSVLGDQSPAGTPPAAVTAAPNWIAWTPEGYYQASPGAGPFVDWQQDGQSLSPEVRRARWNQAAPLHTALTTPPKP